MLLSFLPLCWSWEGDKSCPSQETCPDHITRSFREERRTALTETGAMASVAESAQALYSSEQ